MKAKALGMWASSALVAAIGLAALPGRDVEAAIAQSPLTLAGGAKPNLLLVMDDSGSMDWEMLFPTDQGVLYWNRNSFVDANGNYHQSGGREYVYLFPNGTGAGNKAYPALNARGGEAGNSSPLPPRPEFAFARSADYNKQYFNPDLEYRPWVSSGSKAYGDANPAAALSDPEVAGSATINLAANVSATANEWRFRTSTGMHGANGTTATGVSLETYTYYPATYYRRTTASIALPAWVGGGNCSTAMPSRYARFVSDWSSARQATLEQGGVAAIAPDGACLVRTVIQAGTPEMQNFANWFQYHRKRHLALRASLGTVFDTVSGARVGGIRINSASGNLQQCSLANTDATAPMGMCDVDDADGKQALYRFFYGMTGAQRGTPNRQGLLYAANQFDTNRAIVTQACQKNFTLHFTDGYTNLPDPGWNSGAGDADADGYSNAIADIAAKYYKRIRSDLPGGKVPAPAACGTAKAPVVNPPAWLDCNFDPHMNTYGITLGTVGNIFGVTHHAVADAHANKPAWPDPGIDGKPQVDDLYHAAVNGRGEMLNATSSAELTTRLQQALSDILARGAGSGSRTAASSSRGGGGNQLFQARFDAGQWTGDVIAHEVRADGSLGKQNWSAAAQMPAHASRNISYGPASTPFAWAQLGATLRAAFNRNPLTGQVDDAGERRLNWLRGDMAAQGSRNGVTLRERNSALGDIVNSNPRYVGTENYAYDRLPMGAPGRNQYAAFRFGKAARKPMVYVGANDGMLHAFGAADGIEQWAWIPSEFLATSVSQPSPALAQLPRSDYSHRFYVDGQPMAGDAWFGSAWHTVLVVPMGAGGRSIVALDVTDPTAGPKVLWEYTDADLGHVLGQPSIQRMANGKFAAIFGSGYGLDASAKLFVVDIETGDLIRKIDTDPAFVVASGHENGLSAPYPVDINGDAVIDMVYAGDLWGNLWRFDVDGGDESAWRTHHGSAARPSPLVTVCASGDVAGIYGCPAAGRQPITVRPVVGRGANGLGQTVYFGTGKLFETGDGSLPAAGATGPVQSFYAVFDDNGNKVVAGRSELRQQSIISESQQFRVTTANALENDDRGWYLDLVSPVAGFGGERVVSDPVLRGGRIIFTTFMPKADACEGGSDGWLMELGSDSGARFIAPVIDTNGDGIYDDKDKIDGKTVSGVRGEDGAPLVPSIVTDQKGDEKKHLQGAGGGLPQEVGERGALARGRTSWRQFWP